MRQRSVIFTSHQSYCLSSSRVINLVVSPPGKQVHGVYTFSSMSGSGDSFCSSCDFASVTTRCLSGPAPHRTFRGIAIIQGVNGWVCGGALCVMPMKEEPCNVIIIHPGQYFAMTSKQTHLKQCGLAQLRLTPELQKHELDTLLAAQPATVRGRYELLPAIQEQTYVMPEDVEKLMTIMHEARTNVFPRGHHNLRKSREPYEIVLRLIAGVEEAPAPPDGTRPAYLDLTDSRCYRQSLYKLLQVLRESEASGDYGSVKLFVPFSSNPGDRFAQRSEK